MQARVSLGALVVWAFVGLVSPVGAQDTSEADDTSDPATEEPATAARDAEGRGLFEAGRAAFEDGRYEDALGYFDRAYALTDRHALLYNIGMANDRLRRDEAALAAFEQYLESLPDAANRREVEGRMRALRQSLAEEAAARADTDTDASDTPPATDADAVGTTEPPPASITAPAQPVDSGPGVIGEWWFWTLIGAVVAGGVVTGVVLGTQSSGVTYPAYMTGDNGTVVLTLTSTLP